MNLKIIIQRQRNCHKMTYRVISFIHNSKIAKLIYGDRKLCQCLPVAENKGLIAKDVRRHFIVMEMFYILVLEWVMLVYTYVKTR